MPTYEYACGSCGHQWDLVQRITEAPIDTCPQCAKATAHRLISGGTNFILKGGGWYSDLYASPKPPAEKPSEKKGDQAKADSSEPKKTADGGTKTETKPSAPAATTTPPATSASST